MKYVVVLLVVLGVQTVHAQLVGKVRDVSGVSIPGVQINNLSQNKQGLSGNDGVFSLAAQVGDSIRFTLYGFDTLFVLVEEKTLLKEQEFTLVARIVEVAEALVTRKRLAEFDVGFLPPVKGVQIYTGTNAIIRMENLHGAKSTGNAREMFAKIPGLNIWESDGAGIQIGIGGRGLSPNRTANFNTRQNGHDISADALGYPESYYTPPFEALESIEIIRGSASLQYGTQFGGLLNFVIREPVQNSKLEFTSRNTVGSFNYFGTFNRVTGTIKRTSYQVYHQYKKGDGYRENSQFMQHQLFAQVSHQFTERIRVRLEFTHMNYLAQQAGGLSDLAFLENPIQSVRDRNWFSVNWNVLALHYDQRIGKDAHLNLRAFGMQSTRKTLGFLGKITQSDPGGEREMLNGEFENGGVEIRFLDKYKIGNTGDKYRGAFLAGGRIYRGETLSEQGRASDGDEANFSYSNQSDLEGSSFLFPSQNASVFVENIVFAGKRLSINMGGRFEHISSGSMGYYKRYNIHPVNLDTLATYTVYDSNEVLRNVVLFGAGTSYKVGQQARVYANFTQNYRAINFTDIRVNNPNIVIDSAIRDEYGYTAELGFRGLIREFLVFDVAAFYVFYGDKIGLAPKPGTILKERTNIGDAQNFGLEFFSEIDFLKLVNDSTKLGLTLFANVAYIDARYVRSREANYIGKMVEYVSPLIIRSGLKFKTKKLSIQVQGSYNSAQFADASNAIEPSGDAVIGEIPAYFVCDFSARYNLSQAFTFELGVNNLTNASYFTRRAAAYPGPGILPSDGRSFYGSLQFTFKQK